MVTFAEEILNGKIHFLCSVSIYTVLKKAEEEQAEGVLIVSILITQAWFKKPLRILVQEPIYR